MGLPEACEKCAPLNGLWQLVRGGTKRCDCARGQSLAEMDQMRSATPLLEVDPLISPEAATTCISMLSAIRWFPAEPAARVMIADELQSMCNSDTEAFWLCKRMIRLFVEWPGVPALRAVFCSKFVPLDRFQGLGICAAYPEGIPPELPEPAPARLALPPGYIASADPSLDASVRMAASLLDINRWRRVTPRMPAEEPTNPNFIPITQADIDRAVEELRG